MALSRAAFVFLLAASALYSQATSNAGDVKGVVVDQTGSALARAKLTLLNEERAFSRQMETLPSGEFNFQVVPPGNYRLRVEANGFTTKILDKLEVRVGDIISLKVELAVSAMQQEVLVTAELAAVETERTQQS
ncbi:MAG: carboxypeptidase-like regulatory domain-containing protein, partial [Bryobacter sp.]|nr:carboxypeptidase-like regulatory domain-containing protein [Bryobacter sp.]